MDEAISTVTLEVNGKKVTNFKSVTEKGVTHRRQIDLRRKTVFKQQQPRYGLTVEWCEIDGEPEVVWEDVQNGSLTIEYESGRRKTYPEVTCLSTGDLKDDDEGDPIRSIELLAGKPFTE